MSSPQSVELTLPSQKLKFQSVEKGLIKTAMAAAAEKRKQLRDEFMKIEAMKQQERNALASDFEDVALADEIVNKRRNKSLRRGSNTSTNASVTNSTAATSGNLNKGTSRRASTGKRTNNPSSPSMSPSVTSNPDDDQQEDSTSNPIPMTPEGVHSSIPPQYEKLLRAGLSQEQVPPFTLCP